MPVCVVDATVVCVLVFCSVFGLCVQGCATSPKCVMFKVVAAAGHVAWIELQGGHASENAT